VIERKKLEQKRRFQQKQGNTHTDVDSLMKSMFSDLKLQPQNNTQNFSESRKTMSQISGSHLFFYRMMIITFSIRINE
jgi:hypothetical protein